ncbi:MULTISPECIES: type II toxin-antitoxin system HigB family toxin [Pectobacterium]|uniref:type II toxin-antitoxin system HigB family toxin n=1 Tax=Pectobacterium TaxID=122277 RepID=UPI00196970EB|nr:MULTISPECIES: type II toxin-antitoxin system HigB family toxin [Pectobacterium]MBN3135802.1 type II toxin-antitoxin system HigB family toxin [Pectobacterium punjabense]MCE5382331.1 type II toxin-antitoxin system HigB family toxin [Pectobacterium punjabense]WGL28443.1 type II toxin-antitoxin system HigB family toxin [Pectobacterium brasiliense]
MKLLGRNRLDNVKNFNVSSKVWVNIWSTEVDTSSWRTVQDIKEQFPTVSNPANGVFNFKVDGCSAIVETIIDFNQLSVLIVAVKVL